VTAREPPHPLGWVPGLDVSYWQDSPRTNADDPDWQAVADAGFRYVAIKASEGASGVDSALEAHRKGARAAGLRVGYYHFCRPDDDAGDAYAEAKNFYRAAGDLGPDDLPPAVDIEVKGPVSGARCLAWTNDFAAACEELFGRKVISYAYPFFWHGLGVVPSGLIADRALWIAHYGVRSPITPAPWATWTFWQYSGDHGEPVPGMRVACDRNWFRGDEAALAAYVASTRLRLPPPPRVPPDVIELVDPFAGVPRDAAGVIRDVVGFDLGDYRAPDPAPAPCEPTPTVPETPTSKSGEHKFDFGQTEAMTASACERKG
jgi:GH25 family lysozyme M1 (1,4-beta-N-acetylmuramidase)